jgi:hypothetical protein
MDAVWRCYILREYRLKQTQRLAELHGTAFEFSEYPEQLLSGTLLQLLAHLFCRCAAQPPAQAKRCAAGEAEGE